MAVARSIFWRQFKVLFLKNLLVFRKHWITNILRALIFPIAYGVFLAYCPSFFGTPNSLGLGSVTTLRRLDQTYDGSRPLVWADNTGGTGFIKATDIMAHLSANFTTKQRNGLHQVANSRAVSDACLLNFGGASTCFFTITFDGIPTESINDTRSINYTMRVDDGIFQIDVKKHTSDFETKLLPLQWAVDRAIIELSTGQTLPQPSHLPYTHELNQNDFDNKRLLFLDLMSTFGGLAFFLAFVGITYQLAGGVASERASLLTSHMQAMGALDSSRILSWHLAVSLLFLPAWIILAAVWHSRLLIKTDLGLIVGIHLLTGLALASWSFFASVPFSKNPQLAAVIVAIVSVVLAVIPLDLSYLGPTIPAVLSFFFPSMFYVFSLKAMAGFELYHTNAIISQADPSSGYTILPMIIATVFGIVLWPILAVLWERMRYKILNPSNIASWFRKPATSNSAPRDSKVAISVQNVRKTFNNSWFRRKSKDVVAIADVSLDIFSYGITVLLGPNGAGKSTILSIISGLTTATEGTIAFEGNHERPSRGTLGIVPQKNVLFPELTCLQTLRVWNDIKAPDGSCSDADLEQLIRDCDLQSKMHEPAGTLSGGQKRKLQLAIGLVGGSKVILVDECTSGVDPLSRRALWKTLTTYRNERTIVLTTHFLDEADFLADRIAVLAAPGKLIACDTPVTLKSTMGEGYSISLKFGPIDRSTELLKAIQSISSDVSYTYIDNNTYNYQLKTRDTSVIARAVRLIEDSKSAFGILSYEVLGTTIEDIFLDLLAQEEIEEISQEKNEKDIKEKDIKDARPPLSDLSLSSGRLRSPWAQATTIFHKRALILRRSWLTPLVAMFVGISGAWWPIRFIHGGVTSCAHTPFIENSQYLYPPFLSPDTVLLSPPGLLPVLNASLPELFKLPFYDVNTDPTINPFIPTADKQTVIDQVTQNFQLYSTQGGLYFDVQNDDIFVAYEVSVASIGYFSIASNLFWAHALNVTAPGSISRRRIVSSVSRLPVMAQESLFTLQWLSIFGAAMAVFPAFFAIYIAKERHTSVQAMQLSNGLSNPLGMWMGHLLFDSIFSVVVASVVAIVYATVRTKFQAIGLLWLVICLYGWAGTLLAYIIAIVVKSPLGGFALAVLLQFIIFLAYIVGYIVTLYSAPAPDVPHVMNILHFTLSLIAPINSLARAGLAAVNQFSILCDGETLAKGSGLVTITRYGAPILYLIVWIIVLLSVLAQIDSGFIRLPWSTRAKNRSNAALGKTEKLLNPDVLAEAEYANSPSTTDPLRVLNVSKSFGSNKAVDDVSFTIPHNSVFVLLGPNGAGKTTTVDMIGGHLKPDFGDVKVNGTSIYRELQRARASFGVCPQFTAIDAHLTVHEHLMIYGRLRGLAGEVLQRDIHSLLAATGLDLYADRLATKLSGGNQRKLALSIALVGNPPVILVDEYSTGIDAKMKRELWAVLKQVTGDKAVLLTTHSMEEASYLATKVGIMSKRMLAIGTPEELESRNESYEVHFSCHSREDLVKVQSVMARLPGARMVDDVATRFEVSVGATAQGEHPGNHGIISVAGIFEILAQEQAFPEFTVGKSTLETAFIKIINDDAANNQEDMFEDSQRKRHLWGLC